MVHFGPNPGVCGGLVGPSLRPRVVIKLGGSTMSDGRLEEAFADDVAWLVDEGADVVIVHGGGAGITALASALGQETKFIDGQRYTSEETIELVEMTLAGRMNKEIVRTLRAQGVNAFGLSGVDGGLLSGVRTSDGVDLGLVGRISQVDVDVLGLLWRSRLVPVVAPLAMSEEGIVLNVNADVAAAAVAEASRAVALVYLSDVDGIYSSDGLLEVLEPESARGLIASGEITGGMIPKVRSALASLDNGVASVAIVDGRRQNAIRNYFTGHAIGTRFVSSHATTVAATLAA
jgi:acetylglutamate kinase